MKEIDITSFLTPELLELLNSNPDIISLILGSNKIDETIYMEKLEELNGRIEALEKELPEIKANIKKEPQKNTFSKSNRIRLDY